jgi:hypothetical protein
MSRLIMLPCAAFLRVYEPLSAFGRTERARWEAYAASADRPRRADALEAEREEALRRIIALPPIVAPARESEHAYVRWADGTTYVCPWQTRLRSWLALGRLRATTAPPLADAFAPAQAGRAAEAFARWEGKDASRVHIQSSTWSVPPTWFVPFAPTERWLVLGTAGERDGSRPATASATRTLIYATTMAQARRRVARALATVRRVPGTSAGPRPPGKGADEGAPAASDLVRATVALEEIGRWLEEFHPHSLVELDYGGLVQLLDDDALRADQSVAEVSATVSALASREFELAAAMYQRLRARWRELEAVELGS